MTKLPQHITIPQQLELFTSTHQLNLSEVYEAIPKEVAARDPNIIWKTEGIALPLERSFSFGDQTFVVEISPAMVKGRKDEEHRSRFPHFRESRIEYAILTLASKEYLLMDHGKDPAGKPVYFLTTTIYRIQKEIVDSINQQEGKDLDVKNCPYNYTEVREALEILKKADYSVRDAETRSKLYMFNRIKDVTIDERGNLVDLSRFCSGPLRAILP